MSSAKSDESETPFSPVAESAQCYAPAHSSTKFYGDRSFRFAAAHLWNSLPNSICQAQSLSIFKSRIKTYLFTQYFLS